MSRTKSLARIVNPLSTRAHYSHLVTLNAAFFRVWRLTRRTALFVLHSFVCLASNSESLNSYAFNPNNYFCLASFHRPHSHMSVVLSVFHTVPEQSLLFVVLRTDTKSLCKELNLPRCAVPVASYPFEIQNTTHLMSFALRATQPYFTNPVALFRLYCYIAFLREQSDFVTTR